MATLDLTTCTRADASLHINPKSSRSGTDGQTQAIKRAMSAYRKVLDTGLPPMSWGRPIRIGKAPQVDAQNLTGCGCGCS